VTVVWTLLSRKVRVTVRGLVAEKNLFGVGLLGLVGAIFFCGSTWIARLLTMVMIKPDGTLLMSVNEVALAGGMILVLVVVAIVIADFAFAHTMHVGQRTGDVEFLQSLPVTFDQFFFVKVCERAMTDWVSHLMLLPFFLGAGWSAVGLLLGIPLGLYGYALVQLPLSSLLLALNFTLARYCSRSQLKALITWFSLGGMLVLFAGGGAVTKLWPRLTPAFFASPWFHLVPFRWGVAALMYPRLDGPLALAYYAWCTVVALAIVVAARRVARGFKTTGWTFPDRGAVSAGPALWRRWVRGYYWKEVLMLVRDPGILVNGVVMPPILCCIGLYFWGTWGGGAADSLPTLLRTVAGGLVYFHFFGSMNAAGVEGRGIGFLATLPITPLQFLGKQVVVWGVVGAAVMVPFFLGAAVWSLPVLPGGAVLAAAVGRLTLFSLMLACLGVGLSVPFANYEAAELQRASTWTGKFVFCALASPAVWAGPAAAAAVLAVTVAVFRSSVRRLRYPGQ